ncbi:hypothetical protein ACLMJK_004246 [Lecanora helva]
MPVPPANTIVKLWKRRGGSKTSATQFFIAPNDGPQLDSSHTLDNHTFQLANGTIPTNIRNPSNCIEGKDMIMEIVRKIVGTFLLLLPIFYLLIVIAAHIKSWRNRRTIRKQQRKNNEDAAKLEEAKEKNGRAFCDTPTDSIPQESPKTGLADTTTAPHDYHPDSAYHDDKFLVDKLLPIKMETAPSCYVCDQRAANYIRGNVVGNKSPPPYYDSNSGGPLLASVGPHTLPPHLRSTDSTEYNDQRRSLTSLSALSTELQS